MTVLIDTGPLYAFFDRKDQWHEWSLKQFSQYKPPFFSCEAVITETLFLMDRTGIDTNTLFKLLSRDLLMIKPVLHKSSDRKAVQTFMQSYRNLPASFADSCLMLLAEHVANPYIFTIDSDFTIYRSKSGQPIKLIIPSAIS